MEEDIWAADRRAMVEVLKRYGIGDERILAVMGRLRRHQFIPEAHRRPGLAYGDHPWSIGEGQTISQPFIVAYMTEKLGVYPGERVLEIGTGSGYQSAVLAELGAVVYSVESVPSLAEHARRVLSEEGCGDRVSVLTGDGYQGWAEHAPYDAVIVTCAPESVPRVLVDQLKEEGRMILPVGVFMEQRLVILRKQGGQVLVENDLAVRFVPMVESNSSGSVDGDGM
jgi:protein-L-isoaspartate(D-aspartate) O-methyltransferase